MAATATTKASKLKPLNDRVLIEKMEAQEQTEGGIFLPGSSQEKPLEGTVIAAGPGASEKGEKQPMTVKTGDKVLYSKFSGTEVKIDGKEYLIVSEKEILAIID